MALAPTGVIASRTGMCVCLVCVRELCSNGGYQVAMCPLSCAPYFNGELLFFMLNVIDYWTMVV
jgi:hypothetical protein